MQTEAETARWFARELLKLNPAIPRESFHPKTSTIESADFSDKTSNVLNTNEEQHSLELTDTATALMHIPKGGQDSSKDSFPTSDGPTDDAQILPSSSQTLSSTPESVDNLAVLPAMHLETPSDSFSDWLPPLAHNGLATSLQGFGHEHGPPHQFVSPSQVFGRSTVS